jgi:uncharacterized protein (UPF0332 family)
MEPLDPFLRKALESLRAAELLLEAGLYDAAASRAYFAVYHAARVALRHEGFLDPEGHEPLQAQFNGRLTEHQKVYPGQRGVMNKLFGFRVKADYKASSVSRKEAERRTRDARSFVLAVQTRIGDANR